MDTKTKNQLYLTVLGITCILFAYTLLLSQQDTWFWADVGQHAHAPAVNISRQGEVVYVTWLGGRDATFVDHILIGGDALNPTKYAPTAVGQRVALLLPEGSTVTVWAYDKAVHNYTLINSATL